MHLFPFHQDTPKQMSVNQGLESWKSPHPRTSTIIKSLPGPGWALIPLRWTHRGPKPELEKGSLLSHTDSDSLVAIWGTQRSGHNSRGPGV